MTDWATHSHFLPMAARSHLSRRMQALREAVVAVHGRDLEPDTQVHVSGSLGRHEPAMRLVDGVWDVESDLDLVVIGDPVNAEEQKVTLLAALAESVNDLDVTAFAVRSDQMGMMRSFIGHDLVIGWPGQLSGPRGEPPELAAPTPEDHFELVVCQLNNWLLYPSSESSRRAARHLRVRADTYVLKTMLESLRLLVRTAGEKADRYADLIRQDRSPVLHSAGFDELAHRLVRARELTQPHHHELDDTVVAHALAAFLGASSPMAADLREAVVARGAERVDILDAFSHCVVLLWLAGWTDPREARGLRSDLSAILQRIPAHQLPSSSATVARLCDSLRPGQDPDLEVESAAWLSLREDYFLRVGDKNFGRLASVTADQTTGDSS